MTVSGASLGFAIGALSPSAKTAMSTAASLVVIKPSGVDVSDPHPVFVEALKLPKMGGLALVKNGNQGLQEFGLEKETNEGSMRHLTLLSLANLVISWIGL
jgi:hypothetical protein